MFVLVTLALLIATIGSGSGAHMSAGRLLYGMGRDDSIPRKFFGYVHPRTEVPSNNIILVSMMALYGGWRTRWFIRPIEFTSLDRADDAATAPGVSPE